MPAERVRFGMEVAKKLRTFISCDPEEPRVIEEVAAFQKQILSGFRHVKLVEPGAMHFTLAFLDEQEPENISRIKQALKEVRHPKIHVVLAGIQVFPATGTPRVVAAAVDSGREELSQLAGDVRSRLDSARIWYDRKPFVPHLTIARIKTAEAKLLETVFAYSDKVFGEFEISSFGLKQSVLRPSGPVYTTIEEFRLVDES